MSIFHNQVQLAGRAGHDADLYTLTDGTPLARLKLYQDAHHQAGETTATAFSISAWGPLAQAMYERVKRGDLLFVQGRLRIRSFRQSGVQQYRPEIHVESFHLMQQPDASKSVTAVNGQVSAHQ